MPDRNLGMNIIAVIVTYNRCELLKQTLAAIESQTVKPSHIVLIDNNSNDGTQDHIGKLQLSIRLNYVRLDKNIGGAGGFKLGMQQAYSHGADWLWCMDDDCLPHTDSLEKLMNVFNDESLLSAGFLASRVLWTDGSPCLMNLPVVHPLWITPHSRNPSISRIIGSSFVSMLVSRKAIEAVGYPVEEFFIWFDDAEFSRRISSIMPAYLVTDSVVTHKTPRNIAPLDFGELDATSLWKYRYGVRNEVSFLLRSLGVVSTLLFTARTLRRMVKLRVQLRFWPLILKSFLDGLSFNYQKYIEFPNALPADLPSNDVSQAGGPPL